MTNAELAKKARKLYKNMFDKELNLNPNEIRFSGKMTRGLGYARFRRATGEFVGIRIAKRIKDDKETLEQILKHELLHVYCGRTYGEYGHGRWFKILGSNLGILTRNPRTQRLSAAVYYRQLGGKIYG